METPTSVGKCGSAFVESLQVGPHPGSYLVRRGRGVVEILLETMQNLIQPARLDDGGSAGILRMRQA